MVFRKSGKIFSAISSFIFLGYNFCKPIYKFFLLLLFLLTFTDRIKKFNWIEKCAVYVQLNQRNTLCGIFFVYFSYRVFSLRDVVLLLLLYFVLSIIWHFVVAVVVCNIYIFLDVAVKAASLLLSYRNNIQY